MNTTEHLPPLNELQSEVFEAIKLLPGLTHEDYVNSLVGAGFGDRLEVGKALEFVVQNGYARRDMETQAIYVRDAV